MNRTQRRIKNKDLPDCFTDPFIRAAWDHSTALIIEGDFVGSGTFVKWDGHYGILTAEHVINNPKSPRHRLDTSSSSQKLGIIVEEKVHQLEICSNYLQCVDLGPRAVDLYGPDIAMIVLPAGPELSTITAKKSFYDISKNTQTKFQSALSRDGVHVFYGHPDEELKDVEPPSGFDEATFVPGYCSFSGLKAVFEMDGFDYLVLSAKYDGDSQSPKSFRGYSGGGIWQAPIYFDPASNGVSFKDFYLSGVTYIETPRVDDQRLLIGHGPRTIYELLLEKLR